MILHLTLTKKWFDLILSGEKKEEYREIKDYWIQRLTHFDMSVFVADRSSQMPHLLNPYFLDKWKQFDTIRFTNGYAKNAPSFDIECKGIRIDTGRKEWGAESGKQYFVISLGNVISKRNIL